MQELRKSGIDIIGDAPFGTHFCLFYNTREELLEILVPYFKAGLENNEFCMWITSEPLGVEDARTALRNSVEELDDYIDHGQIEIIEHAQWYARSGKFDAALVLKRWVEKETYAIKRGFDGLRTTGNSIRVEGREQKLVSDYEKKADSAITGHRMIALCTYALNGCGASEIMDVASNHRFSLSKRDGKWEAIESVQRKRMEEELRESELKFRTLFNNNNDGLIVAGIEDKKFLLGNPMICRLLGYSQEEFKGLGIKDIHPDEALPHVFEQFEKQAKREIAVAENIPVKRKDGSVFYADISSSPITLDKKEYLIGAFRDITNRKAAKEAIIKRNEELAGLNKEVERQREQLRILSARLAETEEAERKRLALELHDQVGQKLSAIGINLNIMLAQMPEEAVRRVRPRIEESLDLVGETTECIRSVMADLRPPMLDDYGLLSAINWYTQQIGARRGISVEVSAKEIIPRLPAQEENFLFRIVQEALVNVVKHAQATRVTVTIESDGTGAIRLFIADNGVGFDTSRRNAPNKWGLITMAERARAIGGECRIESRPNRGTRVIVEMRA